MWHLSALYLWVLSEYSNEMQVKLTGDSKLFECECVVYLFLYVCPVLPHLNCGRISGLHRINS